MSKPLDDAWAWLKAQVGDKAVMLVALVGLAAIAGEARINEKLRPLSEEQARLRERQERYEADVHEFAKDVRELYRVSPVIRRSERLESPFPARDAGP